jgi:hypothetical protein
VVRTDEGSVIEAVLVVPVLMVVLIVVVQCAVWAHAAQVTGLAASEGDRTARSVDGGTAAGVAQARSILRTYGATLSGVAVTGGLLSGDQVRIVVTARAPSLLPGLSLPVSSAVVGPIQEFRRTG